MDFQSFRDTLANAGPPAGLTPALAALWWDAKGDWQAAHQCAQQREDADGMRVHAYLHRKEGDEPNANYWYRRAGAAPSTLSLDAEWEELVRRGLGGGVSRFRRPVLPLGKVDWRKALRRRDVLYGTHCLNTRQ